MPGSIASEGQIRSVLADRESLSMRGKFVKGFTSGVRNRDNFSMAKEPAPPPEYIDVKADLSFVADVITLLNALLPDPDAADFLF